MVATQLKPKQSALQKTPIAIIGMSALFAQSKNLQQYWENILGKINCITEVPETAWSLEDYYDPDPKTPDKTYAKWGGFLPEIEFDPLEFGLPPDTLEALDSANLLSLVMAKQALADAGYAQKEFNRETTGVILGGSGLWKSITPLTSRLQYPLWKKILKNSGLSEEQTAKIIDKMKAAYVPWSENSFPGMLPNVVAGRITNRLDLGGTNCVVDAACASSLSALKMAVSELIEGRCDMMLTGGFDTDNSILNYMCFSKTPAFSKKDHLNPFDATSDGMMVGEGLGMIVLKRLEDAERDGDRIYAVVKGIGTASDGRYKSIYAPRPEGQMRALNRAYEDAGFSPSTIGLMEAHGTGTPAGDFCEFTALDRVLKENQAKTQKIALGSVKSQIGHTKAAAGSASLIKATLALHHKILPPTINITEPNPQFKIEESPFYLNTETRPWLAESDTPRRAGVSSFGFGGTDYHVVLEEYTAKLPQENERVHSTPQSILLWANTPEELLQECQTKLEKLESTTADREYNRLQNKSNTAEIPPDSPRLGFVATSLAEAKKLLKLAIKQLQLQPQAVKWEHPLGIYYRQKGISEGDKVVALFPGQGSQYLNMGREIALNFPEVQQAYQAVDDISSVVFPVPAFTPEAITEQSQQLRRTENAQPAIGAFSQGLYKILQQVGFKPDFTAGHSFGELTALWAAGVFNDDDYRYLIEARGRAMATPNNVEDFDCGAMLAVNGNVEKIARIVEGMTRVRIANYNAPKQIVLSGSKPEIATLDKVLNKQGYNVTPLPVSAAFHTPFVSYASKPFGEALEKVTFNPPQIPVYANLTGSPYPTETSEMRSHLKEQLLNSVQFTQEIENIYAEGGTCFVEIGPRQILTNLVGEILGDRPHLAIALNPSRQKDSEIQLRQGCLQLRVWGLPLQAFNTEPLSVQAARKPKSSIELNAKNYIGQKTKAAIELALKPEPLVSAVESARSLEIQSNPISEVLDDSKQLSEPLTPKSFHQTVSQEDAISDFQVNSLNLESVLASESSTERATSATVSLPEESNKLTVQSDRESDDLSILTFNSITDMNKSTHNQPIDLFQQFYQYQGEVLKIHEHYLNLQSQNFQAFLHLLQQKNIAIDNNVVFSSSSSPEIANSLVRPVEAKLAQAVVPPVASFVESSVEAKPAQAVAPSVESSVETKPAQPVASFVESSVETKPVQPVASHVSEIANYLKPHHSLDTINSEPEVTETVSAAQTNNSNSSISTALLEVVSDKTGYPSEMLELEMDLEADLGIDSIKRVEIMGSLQKSFPQLPKLSPEELAEKRTLAQIVEYLEEQLTEKKMV